MIQHNSIFHSIMKFTTFYGVIYFLFVHHSIGNEIVLEQFYSIFTFTSFWRKKWSFTLEMVLALFNTEVLKSKTFNIHEYIFNLIMNYT